MTESPIADPRKLLADALTATLRATKKLRGEWTIVADERPIATPTRRTVLISLQGFSPTEAAPLAAITARFTVRVVSPKTAILEADLDAWDAAADVARAVDGIDGATWSDATKIVVAEKFLAYDLTVETDLTWKD